MRSDRIRREYSIAPQLDGTRLEALFAGIEQAIATTQLEAALRLADSACRVAPEDSTCLLLYARLLIEAGAANEAERRLRGREEPELIAVRGNALCAMGLLDEAASLCEMLLARYALDAVDGVQTLASNLCCDPPSARFEGWVGVDTSLRLSGEVRAGSKVTITVGEMELSLMRAARIDGASHRDSFVAKVPAGLSGRLSVFAGDCRLLGSSLMWPPEFGVAGWVIAQSRALEGRVGMEWAPGLPIVLDLLGANGWHMRHAVVPSPDELSSTAFSIELDGGIDGSAILPPLQVSAVLPDGSLLTLAGSPVAIGSSAVESDGQSPTDACPTPGDRPVSDSIVDIIVPVYAGLEETLGCLQSVLATTNRNQVELVVIDDASPDPELRDALARMSDDGHITLLTNSSNLGFPASANRGMALNAGRDVILLNADTEVFADWLDRLKAAAYSDFDIGTATPLGEAASIVSYPCGKAGNRTSQEAEEFDRAAREANSGKTVEIPVGVGFCLYIKRACLAATGLFREEIFGRGYGEENDLCLRAARLGWRHVAATSVFVRHHGARSFGRNKAALMQRHGRVLNALYPGYDRTVAEFIAEDPLLDARRAIDVHRLLAQATQTVLLVTCDLRGGVKHHVDARRVELTAAGHTVLVLEPSGNTGLQVRIGVPDGSLQDLAFHVPEDLLLLRALLTELRLEHVELHHFLGLPSAVLEMLLGLNVRYDTYVHDYSWICPRISLAGGDGSYCGEPAVEHCESCVREHGGYFNDVPSVVALRDRSARIMDGANRTIMPTLDVHARIARYLPVQRAEIQPWEPPVEAPLRVSRVPTGRVRVAVIGAISVPKGYNVLLNCAQDAAARDLDLEFVVIGYTCDDAPLLATGRVFITGPYTGGEAGLLLARELCDVALFPSVVPETWCYALSHALADGMPIVAFDLGAIAERLRECPTADLLPLSSSTIEMSDTLLRSGQRIFNSTARRALPMLANSSSIADSTSDSPPLPDGFATSIQLLPLPEGIYTFTVKGGAASAATSDELVLPAVQVGVAPSKFEGNVEFLSRGETTDRWLVNSRDMIIAKISSGSASLMLTSLRAPDSPLLGINIQRLDREMFASSEEQAIEAAEDAEATVLPAQIVAHIHRLGDIRFNDGWAGSIGDRLWIEAFAIGSMGRLTPDVIEYCGLTADGYQTPWLGNQVLCGSRGRAIPMVGCAIRLKGDVAEQYDCTYTGQFVSGRVLGPFKNGDLCCSDLPRDPLWGIELSATQRGPGSYQGAVPESPQANAV